MIAEFASTNLPDRIPRDPAERVAFEQWSMDSGDDRQWAAHLRSIARYHGNEGRRIDAHAYRPIQWPPA